MRNVAWSINSRSTIGQAYYNMNQSAYDGDLKSMFTNSLKKGKSQT